MKNIKTHLLPLLAIFPAVITSCDLNKPPLDEIGMNDYWKKASDLDAYVIQFYPSFPSFGTVGLYTGVLSWDATRGTDTQIQPTPNTFMNGAGTPVNAAASPWSWDKIRSVNIFMDNYRKCEDPLVAYSKYLGEAHFFKAWFYFEKVREYGDVPWFTHALNITSEELYAPRLPRTQVIDSILWHLNRAEEYLPLLSATGNVGTNRLSKEVALLFKSRVALYEGTWQKYHRDTPFATAGADPERYLTIAAAAAGKLIDGAEYTKGIYSPADTEPEDILNKMFSLTSHRGNNEVLLWRQYSNELKTTNSFQLYVSGSTGGTSITMQQVQHFLARDGQPYDYIAAARTTKGNAFLTKISEECDPRLTSLIWTPGKPIYASTLFTKPYLNEGGEKMNSTGFQPRKGNDPTSPWAGTAYNASCETAAIVFRYAEALLNYAEAKAELGEPVDYEKSLNLLRRRAGMPDFTVTTDAGYASYSDYGYVISAELRAIRRERTVELACEGYRYDDIRRWAAAASLLKGKRPKGYPFDKSETSGSDALWPANLSPATDANGLLDPFSASLPTGYGFDENRDYLRCVPRDEITLNPDLSQNPGWQN